MIRTGGEFMYFPYLRGRQFELIAIRELSEKGKLSNFIVPIIEPVKLSSTLSNTIQICNNNGNKIAIVVNPQVGSLLLDAQKDKTGEKLVNLQNQIINSQNVIKVVIADKDATDKYTKLIANGVAPNDIMAIYFDKEFKNLYSDLFNNQTLYNVIPYEPAFRKIRGRRVMIADRFADVKKERNNDYANKEDESFSEDHLYYDADGYDGFSDFSIVGKDYQETGFAPYAVAIHIVYFNDDDELRIHHFVSDSNDDISDPANKFYEAVSKLVEWNATMNLNTEGMRIFEELHNSGAYPGLGVVKKLSIMHHLELMGQYLEVHNK